MTAIVDTDTLRILSVYFGDGPNVPETTVVLNGSTVVPYTNQALSSGDKLISYVRKDFSSSANMIESVAASPSYTGESWLNEVEYTPLRLLTCLDLERKLIGANLSSPKLESVRAWIDSITLLAAPDPDAARNDWPLPPYSFAEASSEALTLLGA